MHISRNEETAPNTDVFPNTEGLMNFSEPPAILDPARPSRRKNKTRDNPRQALRMRRLLITSMFALLYLAAATVFFMEGLLDRETLTTATAMMGGGLLVFYAIFVSGLNQ